MMKTLSRKAAAASLIAALTLCSQSALAKDASKPRSSPEIGVITGLEPGDVGCYLSYKALDGKPKQAMGTPELCGDVTLLNKRSELSLKEGKVLGPSCEGDPECTDLETVWLVVSATLVAEKLCAKDETLYHGCMTETGRSIAFCTREQFKYQFDTMPSYLVVRIGDHKAVSLEVESSAKSQITGQMQRLAGANTRLNFRWSYASKLYLFESSYLNGSRLHGLSVFQNGERLEFEACFDHAPKAEALLTPADF